MSWFSDLFSSGVSEVISSVGEAIDRLVTTDEERILLKVELEKEINKFKQAQLNAIANYDKEITLRHSIDMTSDSWLSKNIRPLALSFLTVSTVLLAYLTIFILDPTKVDLIKPWLDLLQILLVTTYAFYFGSRGVEKVSKIKAKSN
ncbi:MAG: hypothetical protein MJK12_18130 [Colwellia sp.]|nr:hypothetical protein [Colwellia sp.]